MSPLVEIRPATFRDALTLELRKADRDEIEALSGRVPREALVHSWEKSASSWAGLVNGKLVCMFGVVPLTMIGITGVPWLLGSPEVCTYSRQFLRRNKAYVGEMLKEFPVLANVVDARNTVSVRWLRWLGFTMGEPVPLGVQGLPFMPFKMEAVNV